ncbi:peptide ABC transporter substrate-binding protein [Bacillus coahuilensis p1.1.43]|uniref:Peptide ABC transporter substrate-binding protein n=1 Tax=Bacillus coahuilensis p1.1.43 TaxID=1150625 RepID=A0A147KBM2_9BACI|nr:ABC transporter substrate-binding protein [Bacillus coahuilensis]KUP08525.1 peptide ABC transporter substrate-binding protein [Bacillus coahuilensis p1.1.43]
MKKKGIASIFAFIMVLSTVLIGCSSSSSGGGDQLIFGRGGDAVALDPAAVTDGESLMVTENIFETLVNFGEQDTQIEPNLAKEWTISEDGLTYTFTLNEGIKFQDGTDFNADAVVANFDRWMNGGESFYYYGSMFGGYKGDEGHVIESITAVDELTVEFKLTRPQAPFLKNLAMSPFGIVSPKAIEELGDKLGETPTEAGTGPFVFVEWVKNDKIVLKKNENYWKEGLPKVDEVVYRTIPENSARLNALIAGEIDIADGINPSDASQIEGEEDLELVKRPSMNVGYLGLTNTREPFDDPKVRQAMNYAINKQGIIDALYEGQAEAAKNPMPPSISGYNESIEGYEYDPEKAKELLKEAGLEDGFEMELWAMPVPRPYMPDGQKAAELIQADLEKVGITAEIVSFEWATYLEKARNGEADAFLLGWTGDNGDADNFLYVLLDQDNIGSNNYSYYSNDELHELLVTAQSESDESKRNDLYAEAQEIIYQDAPWVPLVHSTPLLGVSKNVKGYVPHPTGSEPMTYVELAN